MRDSDADAALYWLCRMLDGGCDPGFLARRLVRMASEDIGNADPRALTLTLAAWDSYDRLGSPEGELALAQACVFLALAPKSNAVYAAFGAAMDDVKSHGTLDVPLHLRNAPTRLMREHRVRPGVPLCPRRAGRAARRARRISRMASSRAATTSRCRAGSS